MGGGQACSRGAGRVSACPTAACLVATDYHPSQGFHIPESFSVSGPPNLGPSRGGPAGKPGLSLHGRLSSRQRGSHSYCRCDYEAGWAQNPQHQRASGKGTGGTRAWLFSQHVLCGSEVSRRLGKGQLKQVLRALLQGPCCTLAWLVAVATCLLPHL